MTSVWKTLYDKKNKIAYVEIVVFSRTKKGYEKIREVHREKAYSIGEIKEMLKSEGFALSGTYKDRAFEKPEKTTGRVWFVAKKLPSC